ncbi:MAG: hypothetical protein AVDCRST_MAG93-4063 [uncultured Chloroflexia bacterium]|uniref:Uncharacterized protein n=1 Tax=uncultured Chloroflexia bacterium TaxID=1672391 RepID=A0A6J4K1G9_9CHLR|nr:MAG: hypothetical protein AVDCRST_MAG93-4063 [uncultured Chloroflexia bacterium]
MIVIFEQHPIKGRFTYREHNRIQSSKATTAFTRVSTPCETRKNASHLQLSGVDCSIHTLKIPHAKKFGGKMVAVEVTRRGGDGRPIDHHVQEGDRVPLTSIRNCTDVWMSYRIDSDSHGATIRMVVVASGSR